MNVGLLSTRPATGTSTANYTITDSDGNQNTSIHWLGNYPAPRKKTLSEFTFVFESSQQIGTAPAPPSRAPDDTLAT